MIEPRVGRVSPRLGLAVLASIKPSAVAAEFDVPLRTEDARALLRCRLVDMLAALTRVDGATISVVGRDPASAEGLRAALPAGVDLIAPGGSLPPSAEIAWVVRWHLQRAFERVLVISPGALPFPARSATTGLSVLAEADLVLGPTPGGGVYLVGVRDEQGIAFIGSDERPAADEIERRARAARAIVRRLERRETLLEQRTTARLRSAVTAIADVAPCLTEWLDRSNGVVGHGAATRS